MARTLTVVLAGSLAVMGLIAESGYRSLLRVLTEGILNDIGARAVRSGVG